MSLAVNLCINCSFFTFIYLTMLLYCYLYLYSLYLHYLIKKLASSLRNTHAKWVTDNLLMLL